MTATLPATDLRNAELPDLVDLLREQADVKYDVVVPASRLRSAGGILRVEGGAVAFDETGAVERDALLYPTDVFDEGISEKLGIPRAYLRRLRETGVICTLEDSGVSPDRTPDFGTPLIDANVNAWLQADPNRRFLIRGFRTDDPDAVGIARAFLSDSYAPIDNYDVLLAALDGVRAAGVDVDIVGANLSERRMRVQINAPGVTALAPIFLGNYRSPFGAGQTDEGHGTVRSADGHDLPIVSAGFEIRNSETGGGAFTIVPRVVVKVCGNGMTIAREAVSKVHLGGKLDEGIVRWSDETRQRAVELVKAKTRDAVATFLDADYVARIVARIEEQSATPVTDAVATIERVAKVHAFSETEAASILDCFIRSGDVTAGGVMQAVTAAAQRVESSDRAAEMEDAALDVLATAAA
ncbi:MAG: DUF932 domain-containing protein [Thermoplasmata archaeon]|nr:DUF932 domain-containing protein [Thermoplasmata archaeon]